MQSAPAFIFKAFANLPQSILILFHQNFRINIFVWKSFEQLLCTYSFDVRKLGKKATQ